MEFLYNQRSPVFCRFGIEICPNHLIYYYELPTGETVCPPFSPVTYTLFTNTIGAFRRSYTVSGLKNDKKYCFVVLPVNLYGLVPVDPENVPSTQCVTNVGSCSNCFIQITPSFPDPNTIYIHFDVPKILNTIFFQDWNGNGQVLVEYKKCNCNTWFKLSKVDFIGDFGCYGSPLPLAPVRILGNIPGIQITDLKITRLHPQLHVGHIIFCGKDTQCREPHLPDGLVTPEITANEIRENSAMLNWTGIPVEEHDEMVEMASQYNLRISQFKDLNDELVNPTVIPIEADILDYDHYYRLTGLAPGTTYYTEVIPDYPVECAVIYATPTKHKAEFTTLSVAEPDSGGGRDAAEQGKTAANAQPTAFSVRLQPNPATDMAQISVSEGAIGFVTIMDNVGRTLKTQPGNQTAQMELRLDGLPKGYYWLRVRNISGSVATVAFAKM